MRVSHPCTQSAWLPFRLRGETAVLKAGVRAALRGGMMMLACGVRGCEAGMTRLLQISRKMRHCQASPRGGQPRHGRRLKDGFIARCSDRTSLTQQAGVFSSNVSGPPCQ